MVRMLVVLVEFWSFDSLFSKEFLQGWYMFGLVTLMHLDSSCWRIVGECTVGSGFAC